MRVLALLVTLAGCGRYSFEEANPLDALCGTADADDDGVGDACDPSNAIPHHVVLHEPFTTMPPGWTSTGAGIWTVTRDGLHGMYTDLAASSFVAPIQIDPPMMLIVRYTIDELDPGGTTNFTISAVNAFDLPTQDSQKCGQASPARLAIGHEQAGSTVDQGSVAFADSLIAGATYVTMFDHGLANMSCTTEVPALGPSATVSVEHAPWRSGGNVGVRIRSIAGTFHSLLVVAPD